MNTKLAAHAERIKLLEQQLTQALTLQLKSQKSPTRNKGDERMGVENTRKDGPSQMSESPREPLRTVENTFGNKRSLSDYTGGQRPVIPSLDLSRVLPNFSKK